MITNNVGRNIATPAYPIINSDVLSNNNENIIREMENVGVLQSKKFFSSLKNGKIK